MKKKIFTTLASGFILLANFAAHSQAIEKGCFYIQPSGYYRYLSIIQTYDGSYVIGGLEIGFGGGLDQNFWVFKIDAAANILWSSSIGTTGNDGCFGVIETADHKIVAGGFAGSSGDQYFFIVKYGEDGTILWQKNVEAGPGNAVFNSVTEAPDGGYVLAGLRLNNTFLYKIDANGDKVWSTEIKDSQTAYTLTAQNVVPSTAGGYLVTSWNNFYGAYFTHVNEDGVIQWATAYYAGLGYKAVPLVNGGYLVGGYELGTGQPHSNAFVTKIDSNGQKVWSKTYGGDGSETFYALSPTSDGGFIGAGVADTGAYIGTDGERGFVAKCTSAGEIEWSKRVNAVVLFQDVIQTADGGYAVLGNGSIFKLDANGNACPECLLEDFGSWMEMGDIAPRTMLNLVADDSIFNSAYTLYTGGTEHELCTVVGINEISTEELQAYPNPCDKYLTVTVPSNFSADNIYITDVNGKIMCRGSVSWRTRIFLDASSFPDGVYSMELIGEKKTLCEKFVVTH